MCCEAPLRLCVKLGKAFLRLNGVPLLNIFVLARFRKFIRRVYERKQKTANFVAAPTFKQLRYSPL